VSKKALMLNALANRTTDREQWGWGSATYGRVGLGDTVTRSSPVQMGSLVDWAYGDGGTNFGIAIKADGTLWSWGSSQSGRLGNGSANGNDLSSPVQVGSLANWLYVECGHSNSLSVKTDGTLWGWGGNNKGQLGIGDTTHRISPVQVGALTDWAPSIAEGYITLKALVNY